jgi:hypothetical protein
MSVDITKLVPIKSLPKQDIFRWNTLFDRLNHGELVSEDFDSEILIVGETCIPLSSGSARRSIQKIKLLPFLKP